MHNKIFKYELEIKDFQEIDFPVGTNVISVKEQNGKLCIWAEVDVRCLNSLRDKSIAIVGTGHDINFQIGDFHYVFIDTVVMSNGLVLHVYIS